MKRSSGIIFFITALLFVPVFATASDEGVQAGEANREILEFKARIHAGWEMDHLADPGVGEDEFHNEFLVKRARFKALWYPTDWLTGVIQIDAAEILVLGGSILKDAYIHISPLREIQLSVGQFKKPFSGLEMRSLGKIRLINRGPGNDLIIEDLGYGDRDLGAQISGRLIKSVKFDYFLGAFNGSGPNIGDPGNSKDIVARLQMKPVKQLALGANGSMKFFDDTTGSQPPRGWATGLDVRLKPGDFQFYAEGLLGANHLAYRYSSAVTADDPPMFMDALGVISYRHVFPVHWRFALEPAFKFEFLEPDANIMDDEIMVFTPGINTYFGKYFRLMINVEITRSKRNTDPNYADSEALMALACLDI